MRKELENRLIKLAIEINELCNCLNKKYLTKHLSKQIIRSSTSAALNYGEAQSAESKNDFIHKISVVLKELRETNISLRILESSNKVGFDEKFHRCQNECDQLIAVFHKTVMTAKRNK
jgi:four helix bundle protein